MRRALAPRQAAMGDVFLLAALTMFAVYLMQMKGWNYHIYPTTAMLVMLAGTIVTAPKAAFGPVRALVLAAIVALLAKAAFLAEIQRYPLMHRLMPYVRAHAADGAIYFFSCNVWTGFPMTVYAGVEWASRFPALWLLPGLEQRRHAGAAGPDAELFAEMDRFATEAVIADLSMSLPELIFVDARPEKRWCGDMDLDFIAHFSSDPRFSRLWSEYELIGDVEGFEVYVRRPLRPLHP
ncbi:MAG: hypothetical protein ACREJ0_11870 [Geminicoccaceae bacterium]